MIFILLYILLGQQLLVLFSMKHIVSTYTLLYMQLFFD